MMKYLYSIACIIFSILLNHGYAADPTVLAAQDVSHKTIIPLASIKYPYTLTQDGKYTVATIKTEKGILCYRLDLQSGIKSLQVKYADVDWINIVGWDLIVDGNNTQLTLINSSIINNKRIKATYSLRSDSDEYIINVRLSVRGKSLVMKISGNITKPFVIKHSSPIQSQDLVDIPLLQGYEGMFTYLPQHKLFYSYLVDYTKTNSSVPVPDIAYIRNLAGKIAPLRETVAISVSDKICDIFPTIPNPVSPFRQELASHMVLEWWYGNFDELGELLDTYHAYGMDKVIVIVHRWQKHGFDIKLPDVFPPNPRRGGLRTLQDVVRRATSYGMRIALHENYVDMYPESTLWNPKDLMRLSNGEYQAAWTTAKHLSPSKIMKYASKIMPEIKSKIGTNACYLDVHSAQAPWFRPDFSVDVPGSGTMNGTRRFTNELWNYARKLYNGPVIGEGAYSWVHAGCIDSVMNQTSINARLFVDFNILKIRPLAINHGVGYFERWNARGYSQEGWMFSSLTPDELDIYRGMEIAYQTAANVANQIKNSIPLVAKEYYMVRPVISALANHKVLSIKYNDTDTNEWISSENAIVENNTHKYRRLYLLFDNGAEIYVNLTNTPWPVNSKLTIAALGWWCTGKQMEGGTSFRNNIIYDYMLDGTHTYLDPRNIDCGIDPTGTAWYGTDQAMPVRSNDGNVIVEAGGIKTNIAIVFEKRNKSFLLRFIPHGVCGKVEISADLIKGVNVDKMVCYDKFGNIMDLYGDELRIENTGLVINHLDGNVWSIELGLAE